jgi:hypothetical protein
MTTFVIREVTFVIREVTSGHIIGDEVAPFEFDTREEAQSFIEDERLDPKTFVVDEAEADHQLH